MSYGLRFQETWYGPQGKYDLEISQENFGGTAENVRIVACELEYADSDRPIEQAINPITAFITFRELSENQFQEFEDADSKEFRVVVKRNGNEIFNGFYIPEENDRNYDRTLENIEIRAGCGLYLLKYIEYEPVGSEPDRVSIFQILKNIFETANQFVTERGFNETISLRHDKMSNDIDESIVAEDRADERDRMFLDERLFRKEEDEFYTYEQVLEWILNGIQYATVRQNHYNGDDCVFEITTHLDIQDNPDDVPIRQIDNGGNITTAEKANFVKDYGKNPPDGFRPIERNGIIKIQEPAQKITVNYNPEWINTWERQPRNPNFTELDSLGNIENWDEIGTPFQGGQAEIRDLGSSGTTTFVRVNTFSSGDYDDVKDEQDFFPPFEPTNGFTTYNIRAPGTNIFDPTTHRSIRSTTILSQLLFKDFDSLEFHIGADFLRSIFVRVDISRMAPVEIKLTDQSSGDEYWLVENTDGELEWFTGTRYVYLNYNHPDRWGFHHNVIVAPLENIDPDGDMELKIELYGMPREIGSGTPFPANQDQVNKHDILQNIVPDIAHSFTYHYCFFRFTEPVDPDRFSITSSSNIDRDVFVREINKSQVITDEKFFNHIGGLSTGAEIEEDNADFELFDRYIITNNKEPLIQKQKAPLIHHYFNFTRQYEANMLVYDDFHFSQVLKIEGEHYLLTHCKYDLVNEEAQCEWRQIKRASGFDDDPEREDPGRPGLTAMSAGSTDSRPEGRRNMYEPHGVRGSIYIQHQQIIDESNSGEIVDNQARLVRLDADQQSVNAVLFEWQEGATVEFQRIDDNQQNTASVTTLYDSEIEDEEEFFILPGESAKLVAVEIDDNQQWIVVTGQMRDEPQIIDVTAQGDTVSMELVRHQVSAELRVEFDGTDIQALSNTTDVQSLIIRPQENETITLQDTAGSNLNHGRFSSAITLSGNDFAEYMVKDGEAILKNYNNAT